MRVSFVEGIARFSTTTIVKQRASSLDMAFFFIYCSKADFSSKGFSFEEEKKERKKETIDFSTKLAWPRLLYPRGTSYPRFVDERRRDEAEYRLPCTLYIYIKEAVAAAESCLR